ncbi:MAG: hypothetical protein ACR2LV_01375 [Solirubrobacteraceae bacterium]
MYGVRAPARATFQPKVVRMASSSKKKTTMAKLNREAAVRERRQLKKMKKDARKALVGQPATTDGDASWSSATAPEGNESVVEA